jgi:hypothetical protein
MPHNPDAAPPTTLAECGERDRRESRDNPDVWSQWVSSWAEK